MALRHVGGLQSLSAPLLELRLAVGPQMFTSMKMPDLQEVGSGCWGEGGEWGEEGGVFS